MDSLHFISNGEDPIPLNTLIPSTSCEAQSRYSAQALINLGPNTILTNQNIPIGLSFEQLKFLSFFFFFFFFFFY